MPSSAAARCTLITSRQDRHARGVPLAEAPLTMRDMLELQRKISFAPEPGAEVRLLSWARTGAVESGFPARAYSVADVVD